MKRKTERERQTETKREGQIDINEHTKKKDLRGCMKKEEKNREKETYRGRERETDGKGTS